MWLTIEQGTRVWAYRPAVGYIALNLDFGRLCLDTGLRAYAGNELHATVLMLRCPYCACVVGYRSKIV